MSVIHGGCDAMLTAAADDRGTLHGLAQDLDRTYEDCKSSTHMTHWQATNTSICLIAGKPFELSTRSSREPCPVDLYFALLRHLQIRQPMQQFHSILTLVPSPSSTLIPNLATFFDYIVVAGHRYHASRRAVSSRNSLALVQTSSNGRSNWGGEIVDIFMFEQAGVGLVYLAAMRWFHPSAINISDTPWASLYVPLHTSPIIGHY